MKRWKAPVDIPHKDCNQVPSCRYFPPVGGYFPPVGGYFPPIGRYLLHLPKAPEAVADEVPGASCLGKTGVAPGYLPATPAILVQNTCPHWEESAEDRDRWDIQGRFPSTSSLEPNFNHHNGLHLQATKNQQILWIIRLILTKKPS